jgi:hypothetical protein
MTVKITELAGKSHTFDDGNKIKVVQIKEREINEVLQPFITYEISQPNSLPRKLVMTGTQFTNAYGHLFGLNNEHSDKKNM